MTVNKLRQQPDMNVNYQANKAVSFSPIHVLNLL
jgi:hypothetical protein